MSALHLPNIFPLFPSMDILITNPLPTVVSESEWKRIVTLFDLEVYVPRVEWIPQYKCSKWRQESSQYTCIEITNILCSQSTGSGPGVGGGGERDIGHTHFKGFAPNPWPLIVCKRLGELISYYRHWMAEVVPTFCHWIATEVFSRYFSSSHTFRSPKYGTGRV